MRLLSKGGKALRGKALQGCRKVQKSVGGTTNRILSISASVLFSISAKSRGAMAPLALLLSTPLPYA